MIFPATQPSLLASGGAGEGLPFPGAGGPDSLNGRDTRRPTISNAAEACKSLQATNLVGELNHPWRDQESARGHGQRNAAGVRSGAVRGAPVPLPPNLVARSGRRLGAIAASAILVVERRTERRDQEALGPHSETAGVASRPQLFFVQNLPENTIRLDGGCNRSFKAIAFNSLVQSDLAARQSIHKVKDDIAQPHPIVAQPPCLWPFCSELRGRCIYGDRCTEPRGVGSYECAAVHNATKNTEGDGRCAAHLSCPQEGGA